MNPNTQERSVQITERIMLQVRSKLPNIDTTTYNRVYEAVMDTLAMELPTKHDVVLYPHGGGMMISRKGG